MNKKLLSERDICTKFITPSLVAVGWNLDTQIRKGVGFTDGRIYVMDKFHARGAKKRRALVRFAEALDVDPSELLKPARF